MIPLDILAEKRAFDFVDIAHRDPPEKFGGGRARIRPDQVPPFRRLR